MIVSKVPHERQTPANFEDYDYIGVTVIDKSAPSLVEFRISASTTTTAEIRKLQPESQPESVQSEIPEIGAPDRL